MLLDYKRSLINEEIKCKKTRTSVLNFFLVAVQKKRKNETLVVIIWRRNKLHRYGKQVLIYLIPNVVLFFIVIPFAFSFFSFFFCFIYMLRFLSPSEKLMIKRS